MTLKEIENWKINQQLDELSRLLDSTEANHDYCDECDILAFLFDEFVDTGSTNSVCITFL